MFLTILHISCCYPVFLFFPSLYSIPLLCIDLKFTFSAAALSLCSPLFVFHGIAPLCLPLLFLIPSDFPPCHLLSLPPPPTLFTHVPVFQCFCFSVPAFRSSFFQFSCFSVPVFQCLVSLFLFSHIPVFQCFCFSVPAFRSSCFPASLFLFFSALFLCSCFQMLLFSSFSVPVFQCLVSLFLFSDVPVFKCSCFPVPCFSVPVFRCSCFSVFLFLCSCFKMFC